MSIQQHLAELCARHNLLEESLAETLQHPASSYDEITALKRQKLRIKDQISALEEQLRNKQPTPPS